MRKWRYGPKRCGKRKSIFDAFGVGGAVGSIASVDPVLPWRDFGRARLAALMPKGKILNMILISITGRHSADKDMSLMTVAKL